MDKDLIGSSELLMEGDERDNTSSDNTKTEEFAKTDTKTEYAVDSVDSVSEGSGIGFLSRMIFFFVICGAIFAFLKTRKTPGITEKSLA